MGLSTSMYLHAVPSLCCSLSAAGSELICDLHWALTNPSHGNAVCGHCMYHCIWSHCRAHQVRGLCSVLLLHGCLGVPHRGACSMVWGWMGVQVQVDQIPLSIVQLKAMSPRARSSVMSVRSTFNQFWIDWLESRVFTISACPHSSAEDRALLA